MILVWSWRTWLGASAVGVAGIRAGRVVTAVPAFAIRGTLLRVHTLVDSVIEDQTCNLSIKTALSLSFSCATFLITYRLCSPAQQD